MLPPLAFDLERRDEVAEVARRGGGTFGDVGGVNVEQPSEDAQPGAGAALTETGVPVEPLESPPQLADRREVVQPVAQRGVPDGLSLVLALDPLDQSG